MNYVIKKYTSTNRKKIAHVNTGKILETAFPGNLVNEIRRETHSLIHHHSQGSSQGVKIFFLSQGIDNQFRGKRYPNAILCCVGGNNPHTNIMALIPVIGSAP